MQSITKKINFPDKSTWLKLQFPMLIEDYKGFEIRATSNGDMTEFNNVAAFQGEIAYFQLLGKLSSDDIVCQIKRDIDSYAVDNNHKQH